MATYSLSIVGVLLVCLLSIVRAVYSGSSKGRAKALSGPVLPADDDNLLYRIDRVHMNSVEALASLATLVWIYIAIRVIHVVVYLRGGNAAKGGSIRTILYVAGALTTVVLIAMTVVAAVR